jgi:hypothetical protein
MSRKHVAVRIDTPHDRDGSPEPQIVRKPERRFAGFDDEILALDSLRLSTRDIEVHLEENQGVKVSRDSISRVTDAVMDDARRRRRVPVDDAYPVGLSGAQGLKIHDGAAFRRVFAMWRWRPRWTVAGEARHVVPSQAATSSRGLLAARELAASCLTSNLADRLEHPKQLVVLAQVGESASVRVPDARGLDALCLGKVGLRGGFEVVSVDHLPLAVWKSIDRPFARGSHPCIRRVLFG